MGLRKINDVLGYAGRTFKSRSRSRSASLNAIAIPSVTFHHHRARGHPLSLFVPGYTDDEERFAYPSSSYACNAKVRFEQRLILLGALAFANSGLVAPEALAVGPGTISPLGLCLSRVGGRFLFCL